MKSPKKSAVNIEDMQFYMVLQPKRTGPPRRTFPLMTIRHAQALGYMVAHWAIMDSTLDQFLKLLFGLHGDASFVPVADLSSLQQFLMIQAMLFETREQAWVDEWDVIRPKFENTRTRRNEAVHAQWDRKGSAHEAFRVSAKGRVSKRKKEISTEQLNQLTEDIVALYRDIELC